MSKTALLLFDIDGTLLTVGSAGKNALRRGFSRAFRIEETLEGIEIAGRTDSAIARELFTKHGLSASPENLHRFFDGYLHYLPEELGRCNGRLLPGVQALLQSLQSRSEVALGLLTGNLKKGAHMKLKQFGVEEFFEFGAFADDHHERDQLGPLARDRATAHLGVPFASETIYILGDTPYDIRCAKALKAKSLAVATGVFSAQQLAAHHPEILLNDFSDLPAVIRALGL